MAGVEYLGGQAALPAGARPNAGVYGFPAGNISHIAHTPTYRRAISASPRPLFEDGYPIDALDGVRAAILGRPFLKVRVAWSPRTP